MHQSAMLKNINARRFNQSSNSSTVAESYEEPEFSYNEVLRDEVSRMSRQRKRNTANNNYRGTSNSRSNVTNFPQNMATNYTGRAAINVNPIIGGRTINPALLNNNYQQQIVKGDANNDGQIDRADLDLMIDHILGKKTNININNVDFSGDGKITTQDLSEMLHLINKQQTQPQKQITKGDANGDGKVNYKDVDALQRAYINLNDNIDMEAADMNGDGRISLTDIAKVTKLADDYEANFQTIKGDVNGDGIVDGRDFNNLQAFLNNVDSSEEFIGKNADVDGDGQIDNKDLTGVLDKFYGLNVNYSKQSVLGDVNGDGKVTKADAQLLKSYLDKRSNDEVYINNADFNGDGKIDSSDAEAINDSLILKGDANGDGKVNARDVRLIQRRLQGYNDAIDMEAADIDNDNEITAVDMIKANKMASDYENNFQTIRGDSNGDGVVDERDYNNVKNYINNVNSSEDFVLKNSDINGDGQVNEEDLNRLRDLADGLNMKFILKMQIIMAMAKLMNKTKMPY